MSVPARSRATLDVTRKYSPAVRAIELPVLKFIHTEGVGGWLLLAAAVIALIWANSPFQQFYYRVWEAELSFNLGLLHLSKSLHHWINDGLMAIFFFLVGMEIKHELTIGALRSARRAMLPVVAAIGGMVAPALIFVALNGGTAASSGWGIPMATDIAFALGVLAMVPGVPVDLKVFLLAVAIVDDIGAIIVIAIFYSETIAVMPLAAGAVLLLALWGLRRAGVQFEFPYILLGVLFWVTILKSGVHATIAGVILGMMVTHRPMFERETAAREAPEVLAALKRDLREGDEDAADMHLGVLQTLAERTEAPLERLTRKLHSWVAFVVLPLFALSNAGVEMSGESLRAAVSSPLAWGIALGLLVGKPLGIVGASWLAVKSGMADLPTQLNWRLLAGVGVLAGIGFTVSIFIAALAFAEDSMLATAKLGILAASVLAGVLGYVLVRGARATTQ